MGVLGPRVRTRVRARVRNGLALQPGMRPALWGGKIFYKPATRR
jgi:hypothetical protein